MKERGTKSSHLLFVSYRGMETPHSPSLPSSLQSSNLVLPYPGFYPSFLACISPGQWEAKEQKEWQKAGAGVLLGLTMIWVWDTSRV